MNKLPFTTLRYSKAFLKYFKNEISEKLDGNFDVAIGLKATDFIDNVKIKFNDGSKLQLKFAFYVFKDKKNEDGEDDSEYAIFSEHNGYFFCYGDSIKKIKQIKGKRI